MLRFSVSSLLLVLCLNVFLKGEENLTPESESVKASIGRAVAFLEAKGQNEKRVGGQALIAFALLKAGVPTNHPLIVNAIKEIQTRIVDNPPSNLQSTILKFESPIYSLSMSVMFLNELGADRFRKEIDILTECLRVTQQTPGGWGYLAAQWQVDNAGGGDMSMVQYAILGNWMTAQHGGTVSSPTMINVGKWLLHVQDESGAFAYNSRIDPQGKVQRSGIRLSTTAAGMSSVYVLRDYFGLTNVRIPMGSDAELEIPNVFRKVRQSGMEERKRVTIKTDLTETAFQQVLERGNVYLEQEFEKLNSKVPYLYYYLYAMERYFSFREIAERKISRSPAWYNTMARFLIDNQSSRGSWNGGCGEYVDTAYGILVLSRSTRQTLSRGLEGGSMRGGRGLPNSTDELSIQDGQVVSLTDPAQVEELMDRLDLMNDLDQQSVERFVNLSQAEIEKILRRNNQPVAKMVRSRYPELRQIAAEALGRNGSVDNVPTLLILLCDTVPEVAIAAQDALCTLTRHPRGKSLPEPGSISFDTARNEQYEFWRSWYYTISPRTDLPRPGK